MKLQVLEARLLSFPRMKIVPCWVLMKNKKLESLVHFRSRLKRMCDIDIKCEWPCICTYAAVIQQTKVEIRATSDLAKCDWI